MGRRLEYDVTNGQYQGTTNTVGFDGIWRDPSGHGLVVEVKTTDAYRLSLDTVAGYRDQLLAQQALARPYQDEGKAMIVGAVLALRNHGGGYLVIGFDNETLAPDKNNVPSDVRVLFHVDKIQGLVSRFASESFETAVEFPERDGQLYPVIVVPPGVKTPVAAKSELPGIDKDKPLISTDGVYIRSLRANNTPSMTRATSVGKRSASCERQAAWRSHQSMPPSDSAAGPAT